MGIHPASTEAVTGPAPAPARESRYRRITRTVSCRA